MKAASICVTVASWLCFLDVGHGQEAPAATAAGPPLCSASGSVGLTVSELVGPKFAMVGEGEEARIVRLYAQEDSRSVNPVPFVHCASHNTTDNSHKKYSWSISLGALTISNTDLNVFAGLSFHVGRNQYFTFGKNWRSVSVLPEEQALGAKPVRMDILSDLPRSTESGWFIAWSYGLLGEPEPDTTQPTCGTFRCLVE